MVGFVHGSSSSEASRRGSGVKQMDLVFYLFLTGVREVTEPSDTSTPIRLVVQNPHCHFSMDEPIGSFSPVQCENAQKNSDPTDNF